MAAVLALLSPAASKVDVLPGQDPLFAEVLTGVGLTPADVRIDTGDLNLWGGNKYCLPMLTALMDDPWKISPYARTLTDQLLKYYSDPGMLAVLAHKQTGHAVRLGLVDDPLEQYRARVDELGEDALAVALSELTGKTVESFQGDSTFGTHSIPREVQAAMAAFLLAVPKMAEYRELALITPMLELEIDPQQSAQVVWDYLVQEWDELDDAEDELKQVLLIEQLVENVDWDLLNTGATLTCIAAQELAEQLAAVDDSVLEDEFDFSVETPLGWVAAMNSDRFRVEPSFLLDNYLLSISYCDEDTHNKAARAHGLTNPVSVSIDLRGNDLYIDYIDSTQGVASAFFGYSVLIDVGGNDAYMGTHLTQGAGVFGTGVLWDMAGDDHYQGRTLCQGAGAFGTGLLIDNSGNDTYEVYTYGQGYGYTMGYGALIDGAGHDNYIGIENPDHANGGPFGAERYIHFAQGAAYGRRDDYGTGHSWAGGVGVLVDGGGNDEYHCEVYGQGTGYWYALGILADKDGDDFHHAGWYSLGSSPHFAIGASQDDGAGDDRYVLKHMQSIGNGRDFSIGWFEDDGGDDWYQGGTMTFGAGDINGIGVFWDKGGDDTYLSHGAGFGQSRIESTGGLRDYMLTLGLFLDAGGIDTYLDLADTEHISERPYPMIEDVAGLLPLSFAANGSSWQRATDGDDTLGAFGCGLDAE